MSRDIGKALMVRMISPVVAWMMRMS